MKEFDDFKWLLSCPEVKEEQLPTEDLLRDLSRYSSSDFQYIYFVQLFYSIYLRPFGQSFISERLKSLNNLYAKAWADFAIDRLTLVTEYSNESFTEHLEEIQNQLGLNHIDLISCFKLYMPFFTSYEVFRYGLENMDSKLFSYFYILLMTWYEDDFPVDMVKWHPQDFRSCLEQKHCEYASICQKRPRCYIVDAAYGEGYTIDQEVLEFQYEIVDQFLYHAPEKCAGRALAKLFEAFKQINDSGYFSQKLSLSYEQVLSCKAAPTSGDYFIPWGKVEFYNGYFLLKHPDTNKGLSSYYRVEERLARTAFNELSSYFMRKLPPLYVRAVKGRIVKILNSADLKSCVELMESKVAKAQIKTKERDNFKRFEKRHMEAKEAKVFCKDFKSRYIDFLCSQHLDTYKVVCCIEQRVNTSGMMTSEYAFIFTIKKAGNKVFLAYENTTNARCTYLIPIWEDGWQEAIDKLYAYFASDVANKRQQLASRLIDLQLPGIWNYSRVMHNDYLAWVDRIKYCT